VCHSFYSGENSAAAESVLTQSRRQIHVPSSMSTSSVAGSCEQPEPSPAKSDIIEFRHAEDTDNQTPVTAGAVLTKRFIAAEMEEFGDKPSTWPRKQSARHLYQQAVDDDNDPARLASDQQEMHSDSARLAWQPDCKSAETVFTSFFTDEMQYYDTAPSSAPAAAAAQLFDASAAIQLSTDAITPSYNQYSINFTPTASSYSVQQQFSSPVSSTRDTHGESLFSYTGYSPSHYDDVRGHRSPASGLGATVQDGRHAVDMLFDNLYRSSPQCDGLSTAAVRTFSPSPYVPTHSPHVELYYLSDETHSPAADLTATHSTPTTASVQCDHR